MKSIFFGRLEIEASRLRPKKGNLAKQGTLQCREVARERATHYSFDKREWYRLDGTTPSVVGDLIDGYFVENENLPQNPDLEDEIGVYPVRWRGSKIEEAKASLIERLPVSFTPRGVKLTRPLSVEEAEDLFYDPSHEDWLRAGVPIGDIYSGYKTLQDDVF